MKTAVIVATYNGEKYIREQLESIVGQTQKPDKIFIFDDCSEDNTSKICGEYAKETDSRGGAGLIELYQNKTNLGYRKNFEQAVLAAKDYDVIFFADQDDWWFPDKVEIVTAEFEHSENLVLFFSDAYLADESLNIDENKSLFHERFSPAKKRKYAEAPESVLLYGRFVAGCTMAIRNTIIERVVPLSRIWAHDEWIAAIAVLCGDVKYTDRKLIKYRLHPAQTIGIRQNDAVRHRGLNKIRYAISPEAADEKLVLFNKKLTKFRDLRNFLVSHQDFRTEEYACLNDTIAFIESIKRNYSRNLFSKLLFFLCNNLNGRFRDFEYPFSQRVRDIFVHL